MKLPSDIIGLVYSYVYCPQPVHWIGKQALARTISKKVDMFSLQTMPVLSNPKAAYFIMHNFNALRQEWNNNYVGAHKLLASNASKHVMDLLNILDPKGTYMCDDIYKILAVNPYGYKYVLGKFNKDQVNKYHAHILSHTKFHVPELINKLNRVKLELDKHKQSINMLAKNPHTFDIFLKIIGSDQVPDVFLDSISRNTSDQAIEYIKANFDRFCAHIQNILANASGYQIIADLVSNGKINSSVAGDSLCVNTNPQVIELLKKYPEYITPAISSNSLDEAVDIILENQHLVDYTKLSSNTNPRVLPLLRANKSQLDKESLYSNPIIFPQRKFTSQFIRRIEQNMISKQKELAESIRAELKRQEQFTNQLEQMLCD